MPAAVAARFDRGSQHRRALIGKVKIAQKEMALADDDYRGMLLRVTGRMSAADCSEAELTAMVEEMKRQGFKPKKAGSAPGPSGRAKGPPAADHPSARKARALWISLHQLGAIDNPSEAALEAFARRQLRVERLQWANQSQAYKLIEALKAIGERHGWRQDVGRASGAGAVKWLKLRLCEAILAKLQQRDLAAASWSLGEAAFRLLGMKRPAGADPAFWDQGAIDTLAAGLAAKLKGAS